MNRTLVTLAVLTTLAFAPGYLEGDGTLDAPNLAGLQGPPQGPPGGGGGPPAGAGAENLQGRVEALEASVASLQTGQTALQGDVATLQGDVAGLQAGQGALQGDVGVLQSDVADLQSNQALLEGDVIALQGNVAVLLDDITPLGTVVAYTSVTVPPGWLLCNGAEVSRMDFADLFALIGTAHGEGDGVDTFNLPDYRGRFLRGVDRGTGNDPDALTRMAMNPGGNAGDAVGSVQDDTMQSHRHFDSGHSHSGFTFSDSHSHNVTLNGSQIFWGDGGGFSLTHIDGGDNSGSSGSVRTNTDTHNHSFNTNFSAAQLGDPGASTQGLVRHGAETRPTNAYVNWIIKVE